MYCVKISGHDVMFPYEPYTIQKAYMSRLLQCLKNKEHGLLESPTGTGKTLAILCSAMSWLQQKHEDEEASLRGVKFLSEASEKLEEAMGSLENQLKSSLRSRIIYCSRTHVQLSQAMKELKNTYYNTKPSIILGSRDQLCVHPEVRVLSSNAAKTHDCRLRVRQKRCQFFSGYEEKVSREFDSFDVLDIEDLTMKGVTHNFCPYYASRFLQTKADVVFSPYNYLLDPSLRATQSIQLEKSVVIFDEGHNIESICEDTASCQLSSATLATCIQALDPILEMLKSQDKPSEEERDAKNPDVIFDGQDNDTLLELPTSEYIFLKEVLCDLEEALDEKAKEVQSLPQNRVPIEWLFDLLDNRLALNSSHFTRLLTVLDKVCMTLGRAVGVTARGKGVAFDEFTSFFRGLVNGRSVAGDSSFKTKYAVSLSTVDVKDRFKKTEEKGWISATKTTETHNSWVLDILCLSPSIAIRQLLDLGVECIIITSGTLSPLDSFQNEMEIPFPVKLENRHVIESNQMLVCVLKEWKGIVFDSRYQNRENSDYYRALGETVIDYFRIIPDGVFVFFSSYFILNKTIDIWKKNGMWDRMGRLKDVFSEPTDKYSFQESLKKFKERIEGSSEKGAAFFAVCRGKLSEGLDVGNRYCRGVLVIGLPYPSFMDTRSILKREYVAAKNDPRFTSNIYYNIQMTRSLNQAIGRVIRHKNDYGVVLLIDTRFQSHRSSLSKWLQPYFMSKDYNETRQTLLNFFGVSRTSYSGLRRSTKDRTPEKTKVVTGMAVKRVMSPDADEDEDVASGYSVSEAKQRKNPFSVPTKLFPIFKNMKVPPKASSTQPPAVHLESVDDQEKEVYDDEVEEPLMPKKKLNVPLKSINNEDVPNKDVKETAPGKISDFLAKHGPELKEALRGRDGSHGFSVLIKVLRQYKESLDSEKLIEAIDELFSTYGVSSSNRRTFVTGLSILLHEVHRKSFVDKLTQFY